MDIIPADLGTRHLVAVVQARALSVQGGMRHHGRLSQRLASGAAHRSPGWLGKFWLRGTNLDEQTGLEVLEAVRPVTSGLAGGMAGGFGGGFGVPAAMMGLVVATGTKDSPPAFLGALFGTFALGGIAAGVTLPRTYLRRWLSTPLSEGEIEDRLAAASDDLERNFLALVRDATRQSDLPDAATKEVREAIRTLGAALEKLPSLIGPAEGTDPESLRRDAAQIHARALAETDSVVADSLLRRAEALERSAEALGRSALVLRRSAALRDELAAQTEALRLGLAAYYSGAGADPANLSRLAESARGVAREATTLADARAELDAYPKPVVEVAPSQEVRS